MINYSIYNTTPLAITKVVADSPRRIKGSKSQSVLQNIDEAKLIYSLNYCIIRLLYRRKSN
jgi:hypothetical protein